MGLRLWISSRGNTCAVRLLSWTPFFPWSPTRMNPVTLFRPVGEAELALIRESGWREFPPRLPEQPIFYPVLDEQYAVQIARDWNTRDGGKGYVLRFTVDGDYLCRYPIQTVGSRLHREYWIPVEELAEFNQRIIPPIEVIAVFSGEQ